VPSRLFGRDGELARLQEMADPRLLARPRLVVVEGEAGIGKTSLVQALADVTPARIRWAQGAEDGAPPFGLWRSLVPEVLPDPEQDRFALLAALRDALVADGGCLLVVDDVQWADESSLLALRRLLRDPECRGLVCCATRRTGEAGLGWERIGPDLLTGADVERLPLGGLGDEAVPTCCAPRPDARSIPGRCATLPRPAGGTRCSCASSADSSPWAPIRPVPTSARSSRPGSGGSSPWRSSSCAPRRCLPRSSS
jgi:hypothetical protein